MRNYMYIIVIVILVTILSVIFGALWYYHPRKVSFELILRIPKPNATFDRSDWLSYDYIANEDQLFFFMVDWYDKFSPNDSLYMSGYETSCIKNLKKQLDFTKYDYIITYQKQLISLNYSPRLTKRKDGLYFDKRIPLIPTFDNVFTNKVYIYQIKKSRRFRAPGP